LYLRVSEPGEEPTDEQKPAIILWSERVGCRASEGWVQDRQRGSGVVRTSGSDVCHTSMKAMPIHNESAITSGTGGPLQSSSIMCSQGRGVEEREE
jgi:hypothetical protein